MKIGKRFNRMNKGEYFYYLDHSKKYTDFNILGLYRSIGENEKLTLEEKIEVRDYANETFGKTFDFLQLKDPTTYFELTTLGQELTKADERQVWNDIKINQQKILDEKNIRHRNFGIYSRHDCGYPDCPYNGLMVKQGSWFARDNMHFKGDKNKWASELKSQRIKKQRRNKKQILRDELDSL